MPSLEGVHGGGIFTRGAALAGPTRCLEGGSGTAVLTTFRQRTGIAAGPPVDISERAAPFARSAGESIVAVADGQLIGMLHIEVSRHGFGELKMLADRGWRGHRAGSALVAAAIDWARNHRLRKLCLEVFAHNRAAIGLYCKCGFAEEGHRARQYRRASGDLWDSMVMSLAP